MYLKLKGDFTVTIWLKINSSASFIPIINFGDFEINIENFKINAFSINNINGLNTLNILALNEWHHVAFVLEKTTGFIYVNGSLSATRGIQAIPQYIKMTNNFIGKMHMHMQYAYAILDDIMIFKGAMNASQIKNNYIYSSPGFFKL